MSSICSFIMQSAVPFSGSNSAELGNSQIKAAVALEPLQGVKGFHFCPRDVVGPSLGGVQSVVQQLAGTLELMHELESAITNPDSPVQMLLHGDHTSSDGNSLPEDQNTQQLPLEMENAGISVLLRNPRALQALLQVQLGLNTLHAEVPDFILSLGEVPVELEEMDSSSQSSGVEDVSLVSEHSEEEEQEEMDEQQP